MSSWRSQIAEALVAAREAASIDHLALAEKLRGEVVEWRRPMSGTDPHRPEPWYSERSGKPQAWIDEPGSDGPVVGFDAGGRPLLHEFRWTGMASHVQDVWRHGDGWSQALMGHETRHYVFEEGRMVLMAGLQYDSVLVEVWDSPDRGHLLEFDDEDMSVHAYAAERGPDGELAVLLYGYEPAPREGRDELATIEHGLAIAAGMLPESPVYEARRHGPAGDLRPTDDLVAVLADAIEGAVVKLYEGSGIDAPFVIELRLGEDGWPPFLRIGGDGFRRKMTGRSPQDGEAVGLLFKAEPPDGGEFLLEGWLSDDAMHACRELNHALRQSESPVRPRAHEAQAQIGRELIRRLNGRAWPGAAEPFLALVYFAAPHEPASPYKLAAEAIGQERVQAFHQSIRSRRKQAPKPAGDARTDRAALAALLHERGLEAHAERLAGEVAQPAFKLVAGDGRSRLGGPALLPRGSEWPRDADGRPLSFLAGIDLSELPPSELPAEGWLLFYADLANDDAEGLIDEAVNEPAAKARCFFTEEPEGLEPPEDLEDVLGQRPVVAVPTLTLPDDYDVGERLGLDPSEESALEAVAGWLRYGDEGYTGDADHWVLGAVSGVQGAAEDEDTLLLLHIANDEDLDFWFLDGGAIQFRIPRSALAARDWSAVVIHADSH